MRAEQGNQQNAGKERRQESAAAEHGRGYTMVRAAVACPPARNQIGREPVMS
jgi:hypothetical protein